MFYYEEDDGLGSNVEGAVLGGRLFQWGLPSKIAGDFADKPEYFFDKTVIQVACGSGFTLILTGTYITYSIFFS